MDPRRPSLTPLSNNGNTWANVLSRMDQCSIAVALVIALCSMIGYWIAKGGPTGQLIEFDRATPLNAQYAVDVNKAEWPELAQLPRIGETLAKRIVDHRNTAGKYMGKEDLLGVDGIGPRTLELMEPYLLPLPERTNVATHIYDQEHQLLNSGSN